MQFPCDRGAFYPFPGSAISGWRMPKRLPPPTPLPRR